MQEIRNIIFDFGGVILNIDFQRSIEAFQALGIGKDPSFFVEFGQSEIYSNLEKGQISEKGFYEHIRQVSGVQASDEDLRRAWDAVLLDMPEERVELLKKLGSITGFFYLAIPMLFIMGRIMALSGFVMDMILRNSLKKLIGRFVLGCESLLPLLFNGF